MKKETVKITDLELNEELKLNNITIKNIIGTVDDSLKAVDRVFSIQLEDGNYTDDVSKISVFSDMYGVAVTFETIIKDVCGRRGRRGEYVNVVLTYYNCNRNKEEHATELFSLVEDLKLGLEKTIYIIDNNYELFRECAVSRLEEKDNYNELFKQTEGLIQSAY